MIPVACSFIYFLLQYRKEVNNVIELGLTTFHEHGSLMNKDTLTLEEYASFFPIIEMDTSFYGIKPASTSQKWVNATPDSFKFIVKAYKAMTKHAKWEEWYDSEDEMYAAFEAFLVPFKQAGKLGAILFQFPSYFDCTREHVAYLKAIRARFPNDIIAIEFRNSSWYSEAFRSSMIAFMTKHHFSLVLVDQPQVPIHSVPFIPIVTNLDFVFIRLHGRHKGNWLDKSPDWRLKRNLYCYSKEELLELSSTVKTLEARTIAIIFNNNSAGDAAPNAVLLKELIGLEYDGLNPNQLSLF